MIQYKPYILETVQSSIDSYLSGKLPILDLEMSAICQHGVCVYCDSPVGEPHEGELLHADMMMMLDDAAHMGCEWIYVCGLGEPFDDPKFTSVLRFCADNGIGISLFSNLLGVTDEHLEIFKNLNINMLVKIDSFIGKNFDKNLGRKGSAEKIYSQLNKLLAVGLGGRDITNLALSIVPTRFTVNDIPDVIRFCKANGIFPSIGEIEYSGKAVGRYSKIALTKEELVQLKDLVDEILGYEYRREICPSALVGMHISNTGECLVHNGSGLSCAWFLLNEPDMISLGNVRDKKLGDLNTEIRRYRQSNWAIGRYNANVNVPNIFGGCGGNKDEMISLYNDIMKKSDVLQE